MNGLIKAYIYFFFEILIRIMIDNKNQNKHIQNIPEKLIFIDILEANYIIYKNGYLSD